MSEFFSDIFSWIAALDPFWAYATILAIAYGENLIPPMPGDMVIVFGGYLASSSEINFILVWFLATVGGALGFMSMYGIGYFTGDAIYDPDRYTWIPKGKMGKVRHWIQRWGYWVVIANRFLSGTRSVISLVVGIAHMNIWRTVLASTLSALVWTGLISYAGYALGENWEIVARYLRIYGWIILTIIGIAGTGLLIVYLVRRNKKTRDATGS